MVHRADIDRHSTLVVRVDPRYPAPAHPAWRAQPVGLEQLILAYLKAETPPREPDAGPGRDGALRAVAR